MFLFSYEGILSQILSILFLVLLDLSNLILELCLTGLKEVI